jgi:ABC-type sulfate transport system substrate-binding protein
MVTLSCCDVDSIAAEQLISPDWRRLRAAACLHPTIAFLVRKGTPRRFTIGPTS